MEPIELAKPVFTVEERLHLANQPSIISQLPVKVGSIVWQSITGQCSSCNENLVDELFRGEVYKMFNDVYRIRAIGFCPKCKLVTCFSWTLNQQGLSSRDKDGNYKIWFSTTTKPSLLSRICGILRRLVAGQ